MMCRFLLLFYEREILALLWQKLASEFHKGEGTLLAASELWVKHLGQCLTLANRSVQIA